MSIGVYYAVAYSVDLDSESLDRIRKKYDPTEPLIEPHIAVIFPVPESVEEENLVQHVEGVLKSWSPLRIRIRGFRKSFDHWLFLTLEEGYDEVVRLYRELNTGILEPYRRDDIEFIPHIGLGQFVTEKGDFDQQKYEEALREAEEESFDFRRTMDRLHLVKIPAVIIDWHLGRVETFPEGERAVWGREFIL
jgi:2'-5' RNA ligase